MFFLLASFMLVSLTMINMKGIDVNLPTATSAQQNSTPDFTLISIDLNNDIYFDKEKVPREDVLARLQDLYNRNHNVRVFIRCDRDVTYENVVFVLDKARTAGIQKVGLEIKPGRTNADNVPTVPSPAPAPTAASTAAGPSKALTHP
ncbi:MAG: biopolymer transporter ExbD [Verrucomicrobia bacterium]|nr:biopolymer transporter ExbD [Verrucomicrobiota bacterium]